MSKIRSLLAAAGAALVGMVSVLGPTAAPASAGPATILHFDTMTPVTGP